MNRALVSAALATALSSLMGGCANTTILSESTKIGLNLEYKPDPSEPVDIQFAYKRRVAVAVPPKRSLGYAQLAKVSSLPQGDLLSTISRFQIARMPTRAGFQVLTGIATGTAAQNVTRVPSQPAVVSLASPDSEPTARSLVTPAAVSPSSPSGELLGTFRNILTPE